MNRHPVPAGPPGTTDRWELVSAGRALAVHTGPMPAGVWDRVVPHLPGVTEPPQPHPDPDHSSPVVHLPEGAGVGDVRRLLNAHLHLLHLAAECLALHAVAVERDGVAVLLLGGHGAGKSLTALALAERGWRVLAGDVTLLDTP
ncbi:hypothetical protein [Streptomyces jumonjinensis]|uniref:hypothetical protein n=1 Tax=Streptomyces jumonjinensis TaxID=1945 RepID=UPI0037A8045B